MNRRRGLIFALSSSMPAMLLYFTFYLIPLVTTFVTSFFRWDKILIGEFIGFQNYINLFTDNVFYISLKNIISWILVAVFIHIPFALMVALILSTRFRGWKVLRVIYFIPQIISSVAWAIIFISVFNPNYGLLNGLLKTLGLENQTCNWLFDPVWAWPSIICTWVFFIGMFTLIMLAEIISIPDEIFEAAEIDGANKIQQALYIKVPLIRQTTGTCLILTVSGGIKYFDGLYIMTNGAPNFRTETLSLYLYQQFTYVHFSYANTIGVMLLLLGIIIIRIIMRSFRMKEE